MIDAEENRASSCGEVGEPEELRWFGDRNGVSFEDFLSHAAKEIPVGRVGYPEDIAAAIGYLTSDEAGFVSGQVLYVAGGPKD